MRIHCLPTHSHIRFMVNQSISQNHCFHFPQALKGLSFCLYPCIKHAIKIMDDQPFSALLIPWVKYVLIYILSFISFSTLCWTVELWLAQIATEHPIHCFSARDIKTYSTSAILILNQRKVLSIWMGMHDCFVIRQCQSIFHTKQFTG